MQNYTSYFLLMLAFVFLVACEQTINLELPEYENDIVLYGVLVAGEKPQIVLTESTGYFEPLNNRDRLKIIQGGATVTLNDGTQTYNLAFDNHMSQYTYRETNQNGEEVTTSTNLGGYTNELIIEEEKTYTIEVKYQERTITGETTVPKKVALNGATQEIEITDEFFGYQCWEDKIEVHFDDPIEQNFYEMSSNIERWSYRACDRYVENDTIELDSCFVNRNDIIYPIFNDDSFNGNTYAYQVPFFSQTCSNDAEIDTLAESSGYSIHKFTLQSVSKELYDFNISLEMQSDAEGNPFQEPSTIKSTVEGGIGVFASKSTASDTVVIRVEERF